MTSVDQVEETRRRSTRRRNHGELLTSKATRANLGTEEHAEDARVDERGAGKVNHDRSARREHPVKLEPQLERCRSVMLAAELDEPNGIGDALRADVRMCHSALPVVHSEKAGCLTREGH